MLDSSRASSAKVCVRVFSLNSPIVSSWRCHFMEDSRGMYFEDFAVGDVLRTSSRTVTSTDIVSFACLSGDFNEAHSDWDYCKSTAFGEPIAHGPLVYAIAGGLNYASGINQGTLIALLGITDWVMLIPVKHGDTIRMETEVTNTRPSRSKMDRGIVTVERRILNQRGEV